MNTPMLLAARERELTGYEIGRAMKELHALSGGRMPSLTVRPLDVSVSWGGRPAERHFLEIEDALVAEHTELLRCIADDDALDAGRDVA